MRISGFIVLATTWISSIAPAVADCSASPCERAVVSIKTCRDIDPPNEPQIANFVDQHRRSANDDFISSVLNSYEGSVVDGIVVASEPMACGTYPVDKVPKNSRFAVNQNLRFFGPTCEFLPPIGQQFSLIFAKACCDGDPSPPCLLNLKWKGMDIRDIPRPLRGEKSGAITNDSNRPSDAGASSSG